MQASDALSILTDQIARLHRPQCAARAALTVSHERVRQDARFGIQCMAPAESHMIISTLQGELALAIRSENEPQIAKAFSQIAATATQGLETIIAANQDQATKDD